ncbi:hypothetical protein SJAV_12240 [Sulfurisphaera javensis]|uniref:Antitoxin SocA-like Panacea domain-containing protein n=1 Tax=Sulfurisphaera javensis TaxID=2049879 RepID=A0AAT9GQR1_9CREN
MRELPDKTRYYTLDEAEGKEFEKVDLFISDVVLILFGLSPDKPIYSRIKYQKGLFLFYKELDKKGYTYEDPHFIPYSYGPYSFLLTQELDNLVWSNFIKVEGQYGKETEAFSLTEKGKREAQAIIEEKIRRKDLEDFKLFRRSIDQYTVKGILRYVYANYPQYKERSKIKDKFKEIKWGRGKG